jgi:hypothetical protein
MDFAIDIYQENNESNESNRIVEYPNFIYDEERIYSKIYIILKLLSIVLYSLTLPTCDREDFYIGMIIVMFLSTMNSARYEYNHFKKYGTIFSSIDEFKEWKKKQWPKSRIAFSIIELSVKTGFFIKTFPPKIVFNNLCEIGDSMFKIHILCLYVIYTFVSIAFICFLLPFCSYSSSRPVNNIQNINISLPSPIIVVNTPNEECCICLDMDNIEIWSMLPCGHKFHSTCISKWLSNNKTCPICRVDIITIF